MNYRGIKGSTQHVNYFGIWLLLLRLYKIVIQSSNTEKLKRVVIKSGGEPEQNIIKGDEIHERVNV